MICIFELGFFVVIVGVIGQVGIVMCEIFVERLFLICELWLFFLLCFVGMVIEFGGVIVIVEDVEIVDVVGIDIVLFLVGVIVSCVYVFCFVEVGVVVIDNFSVWCMDFEVFFVVSEVNLYVIDDCLKGIIVNLNCIMMVVMLVFKVFDVEVGFECLIVFIYQVVFGLGFVGVQELFGQVEGVFVQGDMFCLVYDGFVIDFFEFEKYVVLIVFDVILFVGNFVDDGDNEIDEEKKFCNESWKIFELFDFCVVGMCVCVLVFMGYFLMIYVEFVCDLMLECVCEILSVVFGVVLDEVLMLLQVVGKDLSFVGCICVDQFVLEGKGFVLFVSNDNFCKGVVLNVVQIVEVLVQCLVVVV